MKKEKKIWAMALIGFWFLVSDQTHAQDSLSQKTLDEIVVTATKFPKNKSESGKVLTVITEEQLSRSSGKDLSQLLNEQVGLVISGAGGNSGKDKAVYLRGAKNAYTLVLIDGVPVSDPSGIDGGAYDLRMFPTDQLERIEILKGSQSTLYGTDAVAGVINLITKKNGDKPFGVDATAAYGSYNSFRGNIGINGGISGIDYSVNYTRQQSDGISEAKDKEGNGKFDKDRFTQNGLQLNLGFQPVKNMTIRPYLRLNNFSSDFDDGAFSDANNKSNYKLINPGITSHYKYKKGELMMQYAYTQSNRKYESTFGKDSIEGVQNHLDVFNNYQLSEHINMMTGLQLQHHRMIEHASHRDTSVMITSPYIAILVSNVGGLSVELGARYVNHEQFGNAFTYSINPTYKFNQKVKLFADYSLAFKAPTLTQLYGQWGANSKLQPEESRHMEAGVQYISTDQKVDIRITGFKRNIDNVIVYTSGYFNQDKQNDYGIELEPTVRLNKKLTISTFYAYVTGEITTKRGLDADTTYNNLIRRPEHSFGLNAGYQFNNRLYISLNLKTFGARKDQFFDTQDFTTKLVSLEDYKLLDVYAEYRFLKNHNLKLFIDARNILNANYTEVYGYNTMGINLMGGVSLNF